MASDGETQFFKVPQLRTSYDKVGMFGRTDGGVGDPRTLRGPRVSVGPQIRGTGTSHDGSAAGVDEFLTSARFRLNGAELRQVADFTYAFDSNVAPSVGQQLTLGTRSGRDAEARLALLERRAAAAFVMAGPLQTTECALVAHGVVDGEARGYLFMAAERVYLDDRGERIPAAMLREQARRRGQQVTFTCVYPQGGTRTGIDRDLDGTLDGNEAAQ